MSTAIIHHPVFKEHDTGPGHPEIAFALQRGNEGASRGRRALAEVDRSSGEGSAARRRASVPHAAALQADGKSRQ